MNKLIALLLITFSLLLTASLAQDNLGARPMGMGGAFVGLADDVNSIFVNPAGVASIPQESVLVSTRFMEGREYTLIGGVEQTSLGSLGIGYVGATDPTDPNLSDINGDTSTKYSTQTLYVTMAEDLSKKMRVPENMGDLSLGVNVKFSSRKLAMANGLTSDGGSNVDMDLATVFKPNDDLSFGLSLQNFLNGQNTPGTSTSEAGLPVVQAGVSGKLFGSALTWTLQGKGLGCEWRPVKGLSLRVGRGDGVATTGFGLNLNGFSVDYAYAGGTDPVHYWSVAIMPQESKPAVAAASDKGSDKTASVLPDAYDASF
jgi:hypothetical protein